MREIFWRFWLYCCYFLTVAASGFFLYRLCTPFVRPRKGRAGRVLLFLTLGLLQFMGREFQNACNNMVLDVRDSLEGVGEADSSAWEEEQTRKQKWFEASQAEKKPTLTSINPERPPATTPIPTTPTGRPISPMSPVGRPTSSTGKNTGNPGPRVRIKKETRPCPAICRTGPHSVLHTLLSPLQNSQSAL